MKACIAVFAALFVLGAHAQPFLGGQNLLPTGNLLTTDDGGPYNLTLLTTQEAEVKAAAAARMNFTDRDIIDFLVNVECLEGLFDTWGTFGHGFNDDLEMGGPVPIGARQASLTYGVALPYMEEVALNEQGHALFTRAAGSTLPCPAIDFITGFNNLYAAAFDLPAGATIESTFGVEFDPFYDDATFVLSVVFLEELGATGNKGLAGILTNPVLSQGVSGLATSATAQATLERFVLWGIRNNTVYPFGETVTEVFARISALRDAYDGPQFDDQGLVNTDPRTIAVPENYLNLIPTDIHGCTFARTPQQILNILFLGDTNATGGFFPDGLVGAINTPAGYANMATGLEPFPTNPVVAFQETSAQLGTVMQPITASGPFNVTGELDLTQSLTGPLATASASSRGLAPDTNGMPFFSSAGPPAEAAVETAGRKLKL